MGERERFDVLRAQVAATPVNVAALVDAARVLTEIDATRDASAGDRSGRAVPGGESDER